MVYCIVPPLGVCVVYRVVYSVVYVVAVRIPTDASCAACIITVPSETVANTN